MESVAIRKYSLKSRSWAQRVRECKSESPLHDAPGSTLYIFGTAQNILTADPVDIRVLSLLRGRVS